MKILATTTVAILIFFLAIPFVMAHAPLGTGDNESIDKATVVPDPTKSWALYSQLNSDGDAQYYTFNVTAGQKIHVTMFKSMSPEDATFNPRLVIIGPDVAAQGDIPTKITIPPGSNARLVSQTQPTPTYEPFSPSTFTGLADETLDTPTPGTFYLAVYEQSDAPRGGHYGLAIGDRETYTIDEWILIPFNLITIYQWEGQNLALILTPMIAALIIGIILITWRFKKQCNLANPMAWLGAIAGLTFIGTAATTLYQMLAAATRVAVGAEALITLLFAIVPLAIGLVTLRLSVKDSDRASVKKRVYLVILGFAGLFMWAGLIIGPTLAIVASVMPTNLKKKE
jgi:fluoride ion exporter CrcB/FEX